MKALTLALALVLISPTLGYCQLNPQDAIAPATDAIDSFFTPRFVAPQPARKYVDWASTIAASASVVIDTWESYHAANRKDALIRQSIRDGGAFGVAAILKAIVHRTRPDGSSNDSWPSEHTLLPALLLSACGGAGPGLSVSIPFTIGVGAGRIIADRHWFTDVASGAAIGWGIGRLTRSCK